MDTYNNPLPFESGDVPHTENIPDVSAKNTKVELVKAYQALVKKYQDQVRNKKGETAKQAVEEQIVRKVQEYKPDLLFQSFGTVKREVAQTLDSFSQTITGEMKKLEEVQSAIAVQEKRLKELHDMESVVMSLEDIIRAQEEARETFEQENARMRREREREREEYEFIRAQEKRREEIARKEREEELKKREDAIIKQEQDLAELRKKVETFPHELETRVREARKEAEQETRRAMQIEADLIAREAQGEKKVLETRISFFEDTIAKEREEIAALKKELDQATRQVQSIAEKAIEGSSGRQTLQEMRDFATHQSGGRQGQQGR